MTFMFITDVLKDMGGAERHLYHLAKGLKAKSHKIIICCLKSGHVAEQMQSEGFYVHKFDVVRIYDLSGLKSLIGMLGIAKKEKVSVLMTYHNSSDYLGAAISRLTGIPVVSTRRDMGFLHTKKDRFFYRLANPYFCIIVAVSNAVKKQIQVTQKVNPDNIIVINNGVGPVYCFEKEEFIDCDERYDEPDTLKICCVANIKAIKGQKDLIEAARIVHEHVPSARFYLVGSTDAESRYYKDLQDTINRYQLNHTVFFTGAVDQGQISSLWCKMDIAVCPSLSEGMSNAILEAMAAGKPIVATDVGGNSELVREGINGYLVPANNPCRLADSLIILLKDNIRRVEYGRQSRIISNGEFSLGTMLARYEQMLVSQAHRNS